MEEKYSSGLEGNSENTDMLKAAFKFSNFMKRPNMAAVSIVSS